MSEFTVLVETHQRTSRQAALASLENLMMTGRPFDCDPRGDVYRVLIHADGRSYKGEGLDFSEAANNAVACFHLKADQ